MSVRLSKTYAALVAAGAPEDKASAAAEEIASYERRFVRIEKRLVRIELMLALVLACVVVPLIKSLLQ